MKICILDAAQQDLVSGFRFYDVQETGLGSYFLDSLYADIDSLMYYGGVHMVVAGGYYRMLAKRFPFAIYYRMESDCVLVYAVLDCRRSPAWSRKRLSIVAEMAEEYRSNLDLTAMTALDGEDFP